MKSYIYFKFSLSYKKPKVYNQIFPNILLIKMEQERGLWFTLTLEKEVRHL